MVIDTSYPGISSRFAFVQSKNVNGSLNEIKLGGYKNICFNPAYGWEEGVICSFSVESEWIEGIAIVGEKFDLSSINNLNRLKFLSAPGTGYTGQLDFKYLPDIEHLYISLKENKYKNVSVLKNLQNIAIWQFPYSNLEFLSKNYELNTLQITYSKNIEILFFIESLIHLNKLNIYSAPKLRAINSLLQLRGSLTTLILDKCPSIEDMEIIGELSKLETLVLQNSAPISSVQFIENFKNLKYAYIGVEILDGRTEILDDLGIEYKKMKKYKK